MRPHRHDLEHNLAVGVAFRTMVGDLVVESGGHQEYIDRGVGEHVNAIAGAAYDLGVREALVPSQN